ncbi:MAG: PilW family protein [Pseudoxanthomonas sp.]|nr:PilW family protein [Pseudoxanthomonas sp.]
MKQIPNRRAAGLSLIELMIALLIGTILILGVTQVFGASRAAYQLSEGMSRVQENGRFALDYLQRDIRMAGHFGCVNDQARRQATGALDSHFTGAALNFGYSIQGYENASPAGVTLSPARVAGTDAVVLRFLRGNGIPITAIDATGVNVDATKWSVLTDGGVATPSMFGIADCAFADVFAASSVNAGTGRVVVPATVDLGRYGASPEGGPAMLYRAEAVVYYIGQGAGGQPSLWRARINPDNSVTGEELVEGIENLQLRYGLDKGTAAKPTGYIATQAVASGVGSTEDAWRLVGQVQVALLAASPDVAASAQATRDEGRLTLFGATVTPPADRRYRTVYETTIALRNRLYGN